MLAVDRLWRRGAGMPTCSLMSAQRLVVVVRRGFEDRLEFPQPSGIERLGAELGLPRQARPGLRTLGLANAEHLSQEPAVAEIRGQPAAPAQRGRGKVGEPHGGLAILDADACGWRKVEVEQLRAFGN